MLKIIKFTKIFAIFFAIIFLQIPTTSAKSVSAWLPNWDTQDAMSSYKNNHQNIDVISPFWYNVNADGTLTPKDNAEDPEVLNFARENNIEIIPTITNSFSGETVHPVFHEPHILNQNITNIVNLVLNNDYDGIDIDYEGIYPEDIDVFTNYIKELDAALNVHSKKLTIAVMSKSYPMMEKFSNRGQDWPALEQYVDEFRIMTYDYGWRGSVPRGVAPYWWVEEVIVYALDFVPAEKIRLGIPFYSYAWSDNGVEGGKQFSSYTYDTILEITEKYGLDYQYDPFQRTNRLFYLSDNDDRDPKAHFEIWFESRASISAKLDLVNKYNLGGIAIWRLGGEDVGNWQLIGEKLKNQPVEETQYFNDVNSATLFKNSINRLAFLGLVKGQGSTGNFDPNSKVNRAEILKMALNSFARNTSKYTFPETRSQDFANPFPDVIDGEWYFPYIQTAVDEGIVQGYQDGTFKPERSISRAEALKLAIKSAGFNTSNYDDRVWYYQYRDWAIDNGLLYDAASFNPDEQITRAEAAYIFDAVIKAAEEF